MWWVAVRGAVNYLPRHRTAHYSKQLPRPKSRVPRWRNPADCTSPGRDFYLRILLMEKTKTKKITSVSVNKIMTLRNRELCSKWEAVESEDRDRNLDSIR